MICSGLRKILNFQKGKPKRNVRVHTYILHGRRRKILYQIAEQKMKSSKDVYCTENNIQWKPLIIITLGSALFDSNNRLITLSAGYKNLHHFTQVTVTNFYMYKKTKVNFKKLM
jgi:hypothetical protein